MDKNIPLIPFLLLFSLNLLLPIRVISYEKSHPQNYPSEQQVTQTLTQDSLYFGLGLPNGQNLSEEQWQNFLDREITPRFPDGLTVVDAYGQYLNRNGKLSQEKTKWVILIYKPRRDREQALQVLIDHYKQQFHQESVLRVTSTVQARF
jgi:hypothetical protein